MLSHRHRTGSSRSGLSKKGVHPEKSLVAQGLPSRCRGRRATCLLGARKRLLPRKFPTLTSIPRYEGFGSVVSYIYIAYQSQLLLSGPLAPARTWNTPRIALGPTHPTAGRNGRRVEPLTDMSDSDADPWEADESHHVLFRAPRPPRPQLPPSSSADESDDMALEDWWAYGRGQPTFSWLFVPFINDALGVPPIDGYSFPRPPGWDLLVSRYRSEFQRRGLTPAQAHEGSGMEDDYYIGARKQEEYMSYLPELQVRIDAYGQAVVSVQEGVLPRDSIPVVFGLLPGECDVGLLEG